MIKRVEVFLDDNIPESMNGVIRCGSVYSYNEEDERTDHQELIDNSEYHSEYDVIDDVAKRLGVSTDIVEIIE